MLIFIWLDTIRDLSSQYKYYTFLNDENKKVET